MEDKMRERNEYLPLCYSLSYSPHPISVVRFNLSSFLFLFSFFPFLFLFSFLVFHITLLLQLITTVPKDAICMTMRFE